MSRRAVVPSFAGACGVLLAAGIALGATGVQARELTCYSAVFPPYVVEGGNGSISGIDVEVVAEAARRAGFSAKFKLLPWVRLESELKRGNASEVECAFAYSLNDARKVYMDFMQVPIKVTQYTLFAKKGMFKGGLPAIKGKIIGLRRGFIVPGEFEEMRKQNQVLVQEVDDDVANFRKLALGRVDGIITNADVGHTMIRQLQLEGIVAVEPVIVQTPTYLVLNKAKNLSTLVPPLDKSLREMQADGSWQKIRGRYLK